MKKIIYVALVLVSVMSLSACGGKTTTTVGEDSKTETTESETSETSETSEVSEASDESEGQWSKIDKSVTVEGVEYTVSAYKTSKESELFTAEDGNTFLLIDLMVKNDTTEEVPISSVMTFELTDENETVYDISLSGLACLEEENIEQADGDVAASSEKRYGLAYEVPETAKGLKLNVCELLGDGKKTIDLY